VNQKANKHEIKKAFKDAFGVSPQRDNTMNIF
jgi:ribosomal protein L23